MKLIQCWYTYKETSERENAQPWNYQDRIVISPF